MEGDDAHRDWMVRGGLGRPRDLLESAIECFERHGYHAVSAWGLPGDEIDDAAARLPAPYGKVRPVRRRTLTEAGYALRTRQDGHVSIMLPDPTLDACEELSALLEPPIANPELAREQQAEEESP